MLTERYLDKPAVAGALVTIVLGLAGACSTGAPRDVVLVQTLEYRKAHQPIWTYQPQLVMHGRPENGYAFSALSTEKKDQKVCRKVLAALNEPRQPQETYELAQSWYGQTDAFLTTKYSIDWTFFDSKTGAFGVPSIASSSRVVVDIDNDGKLDTVYRHPSYIRAIYLFTALAGKEGFPPNTETEFGHKQIQEFGDMNPISSTRKGGLIYPEPSGIDQDTIPVEQRTIDRGASYGLNLGQFADVLRIMDRTYILRGGSNDTGIPSHPVPLRLFYPTSYRHNMLLCEFVAVGQTLK